MSRDDETPMERLRKMTWLQWGLITILAGLMSGVLGSLRGGPTSRAEALGSGVAALLFIVIGLGLIILHFVRPTPKADKRSTPRTAAKPPAGRRPSGSSSPNLPPRQSKER